MSTFEEEFVAATSPGPNCKTPGAVVMAADMTGRITYYKASGSTSLVPEESSPISGDNIFWIASCTKLMTTVAVLQCVEQGLLSLQDDVSTILQEWTSPEILTGFDDATGRPVLKKATKKMTLSHLLTHSCGMGYDFVAPLLIKWRAWRNEGPQVHKADIVKSSPCD